MRIPPSLTVEHVQSEVLGLIDMFRVKNSGVKVEVDVEDHTEPYVANKKSPIVRALSHAIWKIRGKPTRLMNKTGTGDMNVFGHQTGKPVVTYGPGDPHLDHTHSEYIIVRDYLESIDVLKEALKKLYELHCGVRGRPV